jgi:mannosyltransferase OCH1-like enzyme
MIPKIIWQTHKTFEPPFISLPYIKTWIEKNPDFSWYYFDDIKCDSFIADHFSEEFVNMYRSLPYGVMKSDAWRIAIIYVYGGIYADLDTTCLKPANEWLKDYNFVASLETPHTNIGNFAFAAEPKHPIIYNCLQNLLINYNHPNYLNKIEYTPTPIQNYGQHSFHTGVTEYCNNSENDLTGVKIYNSEDNAFTMYPNDKTFVHHHCGSLHWHNGYESWRHEQNRDFHVFDGAPYNPN